MLKSALLEMVHVFLAKKGHTLTVKNLELEISTEKENVTDKFNLKTVLTQIYIYKHLRYNEQNPGILDSDPSDNKVIEVYRQLLKEQELRNEMQTILDHFPAEKNQQSNIDF